MVALFAYACGTVGDSSGNAAGSSSTESGGRSGSGGSSPGTGGRSGGAGSEAGGSSGNNTPPEAGGGGANTTSPEAGDTADASRPAGDAKAAQDGASPRESGTVGNGEGGAPLGSAKGVFSQCRFHFGTIDSIARGNSSLIAQLDFFTPGWMGQNDSFDMKAVCDNTKSGGTFANHVPVIVSYLAAFHAKRHMNLKDCNASGSQQSLCQAGAKYISDHMTDILTTYESYGQGFANCYGKTKPIIFLMEPDFYQYTDHNQSQAWTPTQAGQNMTQFVQALKKHLPNAYFSMDISPWVGSNGADHGQAWYSNFDMSLFTFINTSGGSTDAASTFIRNSNKMTWAGVSRATGKPILADTGYGVNGASAGHDAAWDNVANINARIEDGVTSISQYNPNSSWAQTITSIRSQLNAPRSCQ